MITRFTKTNIEQVRSDIEAALRLVEHKHGLSFKVHKITYGKDQFRSRFECFITNPEATPLELEKIEFIRYAPSFGLTEADFHKTFESRPDGVFLLVGLMPRRRKYPILGVNINTGIEMCFTKHVLKTLK